MCVLHHRPICRMNGRSIKWLKEVRKNNMPVNGMLTELTIRHWKEYMLNIVKLISMVRHNGSWSFIITFFQLSLLVSILSFMMWSDEPGRIIPENCKSYAQNAQNPRKTLLWMDSTYELPIKRVTHTHFPSKSVISQKNHDTNFNHGRRISPWISSSNPKGCRIQFPRICTSCSWILWNGFCPDSAANHQVVFRCHLRRHVGWLEPSWSCWPKNPWGLLTASR